MSVSSGTDVCMRKAISYWAMRVAISGSPVSSSCMWLSLARSSRKRRRWAALEPRGVGQVQHRIADRAELDALVARRQKAAPPEAIVERLIVRVAAALRDHDDEGRQVLVLAAQAVAQPAADARPARELSAGLEKRDRRIVIDRLGVHRLDEAKVVGHGSGVRQQFADRGPAVAVTGEPELRRGDGEAVLPRGHAGEPLPVADVESGSSTPRSSLSFGL